ncbi:MAG: hypothetical protein QOK36_1969 [Gaiellales bacterium]|jgi:hypothetical protein|nr:hypothetical protein [Gaiellales bacterium]
MVGAKLPEGHADHGAYSWRDYFKVNTDHKVIGIQYLRSSAMGSGGSSRLARPSPTALADLPRLRVEP